MKKIIATAVMAVLLSAGQAATAGTLDEIATAAGKGVAAAMGEQTGVVNVTTTTKGSTIEGSEVDLGVVEMKNTGNQNAVINVTTVGGKVKANNGKANVGKVSIGK